MNTITVTASTGAELQDDKQTVILDITGTPLNSKSSAKYFVKVAGVKAFDGKDADKDYSEVVSLYDATAVTVTEVSLPDSNTIRIKFSEPVNTNSIGAASAVKFSLDGVNVAIPSTAFSLDSDQEYVDIDVPSAGLSTGKLYTVVVDGLTDYASNALPRYQTTITIAKDEVKPTVDSVTVLSQRYVKVVFSEKIKNGTSGFKVNVDGTDRTSIVTNVSSSKPDGKSFEVDLGTTISEGNHVVTVYNFSDLSSNAGDSVSKELNFTASKPALTSSVAKFVDIAGSKYAVYTYDRNVVRGVASVSATYVDKDGITKSATLPVVGNAQVSGLEKTQIGLDITSAPEGTYKLTLAKGNVVDKYNQQADKVELTFARSAETVKTSVSAVAPNTIAGTNTLGKVKVTFVANVGTDALDVTHYTVDGVQVFKEAIFDGDKQNVTLTLKDGAVTTTGTKTFRVTGVNNVTDYTVAATFRENVKPVVTKAELISYEKIRLYLSEAVTGTIDHNDIEVYVDGVKTANNVTVSGSGTDVLVVNLHTNDKLKSSTTPVKVAILSANDIADGTGNTMAAIELTNLQVNFVDINLTHTNAISALETAMNKDLTNSANLVAAKKAIQDAEVAETAGPTTPQTAKITDAKAVVAAVDSYVAVKANAAAKAIATGDANATQLADAKIAIDAIATEKSAVDAAILAASNLTLTALGTGVGTDASAAAVANKATVKANMVAKFAVVKAADQTANKGKFTVVAPWIAASDLYDPTKVQITLSDSTNTKVVADGTVGLQVQFATTTDIAAGTTVKVRTLDAGTFEAYYGVMADVTLTLTPNGSVPAANAPIAIQ